MTRLRDKTTVERPTEQTRERLERFFVSLRGRDGIARLRLRVPTDGAKHGYGISFDREVRVEARQTNDAERPCDFIEIAWMPEGTLVLPRFDGKLSVCANSNPDACYIELDGSYTPPFGAAGQIFDAAIGHRIAQATAREFLKDLKAAAEAQ
jgi:hypothetical protein